MTKLTSRQLDKLQEAAESANRLNREELKVRKLEAKKAGKTYVAYSPYRELYGDSGPGPVRVERPVLLTYPDGKLIRGIRLYSTEKGKYELEFPKGSKLIVLNGKDKGKIVTSLGIQKPCGRGRRCQVEDTKKKKSWQFISHLHPLKDEIYPDY